jgi:hypothetical protein
VVATLGTFFYSASTVGSYRRPRGDHAKPRIEGSEFAQEGLERRFTQPSFFGPRRVFERLQAIQDQ